MISLDTLHIIISSTVLFLGYAVASSVLGFVCAFVAAKMGDDTAQEAGYVTLNPLVHVDPVGVILLFMVGWGWVRRPPINLQNIRYAWQRALVFFAGPLTGISIAISSMITLIALFDKEIVYFVHRALFGLVSTFRLHVLLPALNEAYPQWSSLTLVIAIILMTIMYCALLITTLGLLLQGVDMLMERMFGPDGGTYTIRFGLSFIVLFCCMHLVWTYLVYFVVLAGYLFASLMGF